MDYADFGRYLGQQRELRGMTRGELSDLTKLPPTLLAALEEGQVERLPERVFVLLHVRAYARVLGLSEEDVLLRFEEVEALTPEPRPESAVPERARGRRRIVTIVLVTLGIVAGASLLLTSFGALTGAP